VSVLRPNVSKVERDPYHDHEATEDGDDAATHRDDAEDVNATQLTIEERAPSSPDEKCADCEKGRTNDNGSANGGVGFIGRAYVHHDFSSTGGGAGLTYLACASEAECP